MSSILYTSQRHLLAAAGLLVLFGLSSAGLQAPNRAQNLRAYFRPTGIEVTSRPDAQPAWSWRWQTTAWGRAGVMQPLAPTAPTFSGTRVEYPHPRLVEWYENRAEGLERRFTIPAAPAGEGLLRIEGQVSADLAPRLHPDALGLDMENDQGVSVLRFSKLSACDAKGVDLDARFELASGSLAILVDDREATYPLHVDPLVTTPVWTAEGARADDEFGYSVSTAGDVDGDGYSDVLIGAPYYTDDPNGQPDEGWAFLWLGGAGGLGANGTPGNADWTAQRDHAGAHIGKSVATAGDVNGDGYSDVVIGSPDYESAQNEHEEGWVFVWLGSASDLGSNGTPANADWSAQSNAIGSYFGWSVGTAGDVNGDSYSDLIVGWPYYLNLGGPILGRVCVWFGSEADLGANGTPANADWMMDGEASRLFGMSVSTAGDVNGDGYSDVIVGAILYDSPDLSEGGAFVYQGSATGLSSTPMWTAEGDQFGAWFGSSVGTAGDVNGDGYSDVIVGAPCYDTDASDGGKVFVYHGSAGGLPATPSWTMVSNQLSGYFGRSVASAGDVNGDGYGDVIIGAPFYDSGQTDEGLVLVWYGSAQGLEGAVDWLMDSDQSEAGFGVSVATAGDVNGDGYSDVIIGADLYDNGELNEGAAFVYHGSESGLETSASWTGDGDMSGIFYGLSVATAGDVNRDGYSDVIVGAQGYDGGETNEGRAYVYHGSAAGLSLAPDWTEERNQAFEAFGGSVGTAGDVNGDGFSDVIIGAVGFDGSHANDGRAWVYHGSASGLSNSAAWFADVDQDDARLGRCVGSAGDVNGDGFSDVLVGASLMDNGQVDEGRAFLYYGNNGDGLDRRVRQQRSDGTALIYLLGRSESPTSFRLLARGRTAAGRGSVRLEWEVKPLGTPLDGTGIEIGPEFDTGAPVAGTGSAVSLYQLATGLTANDPYHWRLRIASDSPFFPQTPWLSLPYNAVTETDLRGAESASATPEADGGTLGAWLRLGRNPFRGDLPIEYAVPQACEVRIEVCDLTGRRVRTLDGGWRVPGLHSAIWDGTDERGGRLPSGMYVLRLKLGEDAALTRKVIHIK